METLFIIHHCIHSLKEKASMSFSLVQVVPRSSFAMGHEQGETFFAKSGARTKYSSFLPRTTTGGKMRCPKRTHVTPPTMNEDVDMSEDDERPSSTSIRDETKLINQTTSSPSLPARHDYVTAIAGPSAT